MQDRTIAATDPVYGVDSGRTYESRGSAVSWGAILGGALAAFAVTMVLLTAAAALGLSAVSPWAHSGASAATFTLGAGIAVVIIQCVASGFGGYITGRLRTKWVAVHTNEVYFRDTAHGLLAWAVASLIGAMLVGSALSSAVGAGTSAVATVAAGAAQGAGPVAAQMLQGQQFGLDALFRGARPDATATAADVRGEVGRIIANAMGTSGLAPADRTYVAELIAARSGIPLADAQKRVDDTIAQAKAAETQARQAADNARKSATVAALFGAVAMLLGAFVACLGAAFGGRQRDDHDENDLRTHPAI